MDGFQAYSLGMTAVCSVFGGLVTYYAFRAARRTGQRALWFLALGMGLVAAGAIATGGIYISLDLEISRWVGVVSTLSAIGFVILGYSLYAGESVP